MNLSHYKLQTLAIEIIDPSWHAYCSVVVVDIIFVVIVVVVVVIVVIVVVVVDVDGVDHGEDSVRHGEDKRQESKRGKLSVAAWKWEFGAHLKRN